MAAANPSSLDDAPPAECAESPSSAAASTPGIAKNDDTYREQIKLIQQIFGRFNHQGSDKVLIERVPELVSALGRELRVGHEVSLAIVAKKDVASLLSGGGVVELVSFEEVIQALKNVEEAAPDADEGEASTPLTLLRRLQDYRKKCEMVGDYVEAQKARRKYEELRSKEEDRQRKLVDMAQQHEMNEVEEAQKQQFLGFSAAWDKYMADYESTAYMSLERLKEQHASEFSLFQEKVRNQPVKLKASKELLEMRRKHEALAKMGKYADAFKAKEAADQQEELELARSHSLLQDSARKAEERLRAQHRKALAALLKRIQRDRGEQIRHRQTDSQRLIQRNKNLKVDLSKKQHLEFQRAEAAIRTIMSQPEHAQKLLDEKDPACVARSAAMGELPALSRARWKGPCLPENYQPPGGITKGHVRASPRGGSLPPAAATL